MNLICRQVDIHCRQAGKFAFGHPSANPEYRRTTLSGLQGHQFENLSFVRRSAKSDLRNITYPYKMIYRYNIILRKTQI
jgi:hypothetical protein